jgi:two-component system nitrogen regulation response regulator GlnG
MPPEAQTRLLRVLQEGEYTTVGGRTPIKANVRIVAATTRTCAGHQARACSARICSTASTSCRSACRRCASGPRTSRCWSKHFLERAKASGLPGAAEEGQPTTLAGTIERHLRDYFDSHNGQLPPRGLYDRVLRELERPLISLTLAATRGNQVKAAEILGLNRNTLRKKIRDLEIGVVRGVK